jgi:hypothetical protein
MLPDGLRVGGCAVAILNIGNDESLLTDDYAGVVYYVYRKQ